MNESVTHAAMLYIRKLFAANADGHDAEHSLRVYRNAVLIADAYPEADMTVISLSALLHDADDHKLFQTKHNENARWFLESKGISPEMIERICEVINSVSFSKNKGSRPETLEGEIVQDADRLDAIGAVGIARTFAYGGSHGRTLTSSIQHFYDKLLLLRDLLNTEKAKEIAQSRHVFMEQFLAQYQSESDYE